MTWCIKSFRLLIMIKINVLNKSNNCMQSSNSLNELANFRSETIILSEQIWWANNRNEIQLFAKEKQFVSGSNTLAVVGWQILLVNTEVINHQKYNLWLSSNESKNNRWLLCVMNDECIGSTYGTMMWCHWYQYQTIETE